LTAWLSERAGRVPGRALWRCRFPGLLRAGQDRGVGGDV